MISCTSREELFSAIPYVRQADTYNVTPCAPRVSIRAPRITCASSRNISMLSAFNLSVRDRVTQTIPPSRRVTWTEGRAGAVHTSRREPRKAYTLPAATLLFTRYPKGYEGPQYLAWALFNITRCVPACQRGIVCKENSAPEIYLNSTPPHS
eukprot:194695-Pleurochrysis_carterae.AAC.6